MRATIMPKAHDVRIDNVPDAAIKDPTDAVIRITRACICGSDLWPYNGGPNVEGQRMGHEAIGVVEDVGRDVQRIKRGQVVIMPFADSDGTCLFCEEGLPTACIHRGFFGNGTGLDGAQAEALRIPYADGTLYPLNVGEDDALMPSLLTLSDVMGTGHHAAVTARTRPGGNVAVVRVGAPHYEATPGAQQMFYNNVSVAGGPAPTRAYIDELLPEILEGRIDPGRVFDRTVDLDGVPDGYRAMNDREALKVLVQP